MKSQEESSPWIGQWHTHVDTSYFPFTIASGVGDKPFFSGLKAKSIVSVERETTGLGGK